MKDAEAAGCQIIEAAEGVDDLSAAGARDREGDRVHGEVAAGEVGLDGRAEAD